MCSRYALAGWLGCHWLVWLRETGYAVIWGTRGRVQEGKIAGMRTRYTLCLLGVGDLRVQGQCNFAAAAECSPGLGQA